MLAPCVLPQRQGTGVVIQALSAQLSAAGHRVHLVSYAGHGSAGSTSLGAAAAAQWSAPPYTHHWAAHPPVPIRSGPNWARPCADAGLFFCALRVAMRVRFDLIVAHHCEGVFVGALLRALLGLPLVGHLHARLAYELPTYGIRPRWPRLWQLAGAAVDHLCAQLPDGIVTLSQADACFARRVRRDQGSPAVVTVRPQVEQPSATPTGLRWQTRSLHTPETFWAVYSGNADGYQNLPLLVDAMGYLTRRCPAVRLLVATHGSLDRLHNLNWPHNVVLRSATDYTQMQQLLRQATVGVCPRRLPTGYPIKCLNYWACGLTVVGLRRMACAVWGNSKQDCVHGRAIWTVDHPHSFAEGILAAFRI